MESLEHWMPPHPRLGLAMDYSIEAAEEALADIPMPEPEPDHLPDAGQMVDDSNG